MNNPMNDIWGSWKMQNLDEKHYYRMGSWSNQQAHNPRLFVHIWKAMSDRFITIRCRLEALIAPGYSAVDQQCSCA
jgi:hypothetical protein